MNAGIVVIGRNEGQRLIGCLGSLAPLNLPIVYVDSASTDGSPDTARRMGAHVVDLDLSRPFSPGRARNEGYEALKRERPQIEFVQFIDGDCKLAPEWLSAAAAFLSEFHGVAVVCGRRKEQNPGASLYNQLCDIEWNTPVGEAAACGGDSLMRCASFEAAGGFNAALIAGEEPELCARLRDSGWRIWRLDAEMTAHDAALTHFSQWWRRTMRGGFGYAQVWDSTRRNTHVLYQTELARAVIWGGLIPATVLAAAALYAPALLALPVLYGAQVLRLALRYGPESSLSWTRAFFLTLAKFPEFQGAVRYGWRRLSGSRFELIEYKKRARRGIGSP